MTVREKRTVLISIAKKKKKMVRSLDERGMLAVIYCGGDSWWETEQMT